MRIHFSRSIGMLVLSVSLLVATGQASAGPALVSFTNPSVFGSQDNSLGYRFTANANLQVSALGYYDPGGIPLNATHGVGIFNSAGSLLGSVNVNNAGSVLGDFRYVSLGSALSLTSGQSYFIAGTTQGNDNWVYQASNIVTDPGVTYTGSYFVSSTGGTLAFPANPAIDRQYLTVNFVIGAAAVPEPGMLALAGMGGLSLLGYARRRVRA